MPFVNIFIYHFRFNELNIDVYKDYRTSLAYDLTQKLQKNACSGHSDLVARRMGFIPLPLGVVMARVLLTSINIYNLPAVIILFIGYVIFIALSQIYLLSHAKDIWLLYFYMVWLSCRVSLGVQKPHRERWINNQKT